MQNVWENEEVLQQRLEDAETSVQQLKGTADGMDGDALNAEVKACEAGLKKITALLTVQKKDIEFFGKNNGQVSAQDQAKLQAQYLVPFQERHARLKATLAEVAKLKSKNEAKASKARQELFGNKSLQPPKTQEEEEQEMIDMAEGTTAQQILGTAQGVNKDALNALERVERDLDQQNKLADQIAVDLAKQYEDIELIEDEMDNLANQVKRARREVGQFSRRLATDRCFICLFIMVLLLIVAVVGIKVFNKHEESQDRDNALLFEDDDRGRRR